MSNEHDLEEDELVEIRSALGQAKDVSGAFFRQRVILFVIRWIIGFALIGAIVYFYPELQWLWWAGLAIATLSLAFMVGAKYFLSRKITNVESSLAGAEAALNEEEDE